MLRSAEGNDFAAILDGSSLGTVEALVTQEAGICALEDLGSKSLRPSEFSCLADVETVAMERVAAEKARAEGRYQAASVWLHISQIGEKLIATGLKLRKCDGYIVLAVDPRAGEVDAHGPYYRLSATLKTGSSPL